MRRPGAGTRPGPRTGCRGRGRPQPSPHMGASGRTVTTANPDSTAPYLEEGMTHKAYLIPLCLAAMAGAAVPSALAQHGPDKPETVLYVWASDQAHRAPDFLAVVDFDQDSATYGKVIE